MTRSLLTDRFRLMFRWETRRQPVYELVVAKGGSKLKGGDPTKPGTIGVRDGQIFGASAPLDSLTKMLTGELGRLVIDNTGLTGTFDFSLTFVPVQPGAATDPSDEPSIFTAIQEQLGLKLDSAQGPVEVLVIDYVERPTEN